MTIAALVEPSLLIWARKMANYESKAAARKMGVPDERVAEWEAGVRKPTIAELRKAARVYGRPLGVFFLPEPPQGFETLRDFRRVYGSPAAEWSPALHEEYRRAHAQRDALQTIAELDDTHVASAWRVMGLPDSNADIAQSGRALLRAVAPLPEPTSAADEFKHLNYWIAAMETAGVLVIHTAGGRVATAEMRAFSLYFDEVPVVVLNGKDWPRGRLFSLLHEYAHLLLHTGGLCDTRTDTVAVTEDRRLEARCNAIAAAILMPEDSVLRSPAVASRPAGYQWSLSELVEAAKPFGVSVESFLRRLADLGQVPMTYYRTFRDGQTEEVTRGSRSGQGEFYRTKARDIGKGYVRSVADAYDRHVIDTTTAAGFLDVKAGQIPKLAESARL